jgi:hypothetical protein
LSTKITYVLLSFIEFTFGKRKPDEYETRQYHGNRAFILDSAHVIAGQLKR